MTRPRADSAAALATQSEADRQFSSHRFLVPDTHPTSVPAHPPPPNVQTTLCCCRNRCYATTDCASFLKTCPFTNDTPKGASLADCLPDKSDFKKAACSADAKGKINSTDGKAVPLKANVTCFQSEKLTCQIYRNATGHSHITAACKAPPKKASGAGHQVSSNTLWQCCLLLALLVSSHSGCVCACTCCNAAWCCLLGCWGVCVEHS